MCGCGASKGVVIPRQNKDVCRECDKSLWRHDASRARAAGARFFERRPLFFFTGGRARRFFKWCKGCKNFLQIGNFSQKLDAAKCDKCRERGRQSYMSKRLERDAAKRAEADAGKAP